MCYTALHNPGVMQDGTIVERTPCPVTSDDAILKLGS